MSITIYQRLSQAYWPPDKGAGASADRQAGNAAVDALTLGELAAFYQECAPHFCGPTYCIVTERVQELLKAFPPHIEDKKRRLEAAIEQARLAWMGFKKVIDDVVAG